MYSYSHSTEIEKKKIQALKRPHFWGTSLYIWQNSSSKSASLSTASAEKPASEWVKDSSNLIFPCSGTLQQAWNEDAVKKSLIPATGPAAPPLPSPFLFGGSGEENISFQHYQAAFLKDAENTYTGHKSYCALCSVMAHSSIHCTYLADLWFSDVLHTTSKRRSFCCLGFSCTVLPYS